jgi:hypothetical protein
VTGLAILLAAVGLGDLAAGGLSGEVVPGRRLWLASAVATLTLWLAAAGFGWGWPLVLALNLGVLGWLQGRARDRLGLALASLTITLTIPFVAGAVLSSSLDVLTQWLSRSPFPLLSGLDGDGFLTRAAMLVFLSGTSNALVRSILTLSKTSWQSSQERLRGGRVIGVLERWLIVSMVLSGQPTAAALVVSAKSLLRFPEISRTQPQDAGTPGSDLAQIDEITEYFLLGSMTSWALALLPALLFQ